MSSPSPHATHILEVVQVRPSTAAPPPDGTAVAKLRPIVGYSDLTDIDDWSMVGGVLRVATSLTKPGAGKSRNTYHVVCVNSIRDAICRWSQEADIYEVPPAHIRPMITFFDKYQGADSDALSNAFLESVLERRPVDMGSCASDLLDIIRNVPIIKVPRSNALKAYKSVARVSTDGVPDAHESDEFREVDMDEESAMIEHRANDFMVDATSLDVAVERMDLRDEYRGTPQRLFLNDILHQQYPPTTRIGEHFTVEGIRRVIMSDGDDLAHQLKLIDGPYSQLPDAGQRPSKAFYQSQNHKAFMIFCKKKKDVEMQTPLERKLYFPDDLTNGTMYQAVACVYVYFDRKEIVSKVYVPINIIVRKYGNPMCSTVMIDGVPNDMTFTKVDGLRADVVQLMRISIGSDGRFPFSAGNHQRRPTFLSYDRVVSHERKQYILTMFLDTVVIRDDDDPNNVTLCRIRYNGAPRFTDADHWYDAVPTGPYPVGVMNGVRTYVDRTRSTAAGTKQHKAKRRRMIKQKREDQMASDDDADVEM